MFLCDTNVVSELTRPQPNVGVVNWLDRTPTLFLHVSVVTVEELSYGVTANPKAEVLNWLNTTFKVRFNALKVSVEIAKLAGEMRGQFRRQGTPRAQADMLIVATAKVYGFTLVTRNVRDFEGCGVAVLNPFR